MEDEIPPKVNEVSQSNENLIPDESTLLSQPVDDSSASLDVAKIKEKNSRRQNTSRSK